jgi:hypothetical protein
MQLHWPFRKQAREIMDFAEIMALIPVGAKLIEDAESSGAIPELEADVKALEPIFKDAVALFGKLKADPTYEADITSLFSKLKGIKI